jgi:hypothetical protein
VDSDGSRIDVTAADGRKLTVIDANANTVIGAVTTDRYPGGYPIHRCEANGTLSVTDDYDSTVYAVAVATCRCDRTRQT